MTEYSSGLAIIAAIIAILTFLTAIVVDDDSCQFWHSVSLVLNVARFQSVNGRYVTVSILDTDDLNGHAFLANVLSDMRRPML
jgi:hypothetical protein